MAKTLADILIPLAGSISNEKALAMRKACDELEAKVETLKLRVNGLESMVLELKDATKNIALHTDETLRAVRGGGCTCTHEKRLHANATDGCLVSGCGCEMYTGEGSGISPRCVSVGQSKAEASGNRASEHAGVAPSGTTPTSRSFDKLAPTGAPSPASSVPAPATGEVPEWVPSVEEIQQFIDDGREGDLRALIASRAPAQPSVEEMAERLRVAWNAWAGYAPGVVISPSDCWLALARAAIGGGK